MATRYFPDALLFQISKCTEDVQVFLISAAEEKLEREREANK
jgi:hypothetical protein